MATPFLGFDKFIHFGPKPEGGNPEELGAKYAQADQHEKSLPYLEQLVRNSPQSALSNFNLARNYLLLNKLEPALFHFNAAVKADPQHDQNEISKANIGHISKILKIDMEAWNSANPVIFKQHGFQAGGGFVEDEVDPLDFEDEDDEETEEEENILAAPAEEGSRKTEL
eukprot:CAMPEP_0175151756 /NCGR_PEP_ID=MMETSP0087-20121206/18702_1 /TAXON_ID=136419 /ORGANISM="Unknown Unknown, Strain D1" /LENGTH=168 /DNA_ID=CAMNT_0016438047 /DNA_START=57 /DNA_END=563 /DNA_ORIENTATION=-